MRMSDVPATLRTKGFFVGRFRCLLSGVTSQRIHGMVYLPTFTIKNQPFM